MCVKEKGGRGGSPPGGAGGPPATSTSFLDAIAAALLDGHLGLHGASDPHQAVPEAEPLRRHAHPRAQGGSRAHAQPNEGATPLRDSPSPASPLGRHPLPLPVSLVRVQELFPEHYDFYPQTWVLPEDFPDFAAQFDEKRRSAKTFICKPSKGCQGRGIFLTRTLDNIDPHLQQVAQRYVHKPFLLDGFKFDLRVYVLVLSIAPLRIYLFEDGLVRLCTTKYVAPTRTNLRTSTMHLTNYAINKNSDEFVFNSDPARGDVGSKRSLQWFRWWLQHNGYNAQLVWARIGHMAIKTIIAAQPELAHNYRSVAGIGGAATARSCFEILGLDVLLDAKCVQPERAALE